MVLGKTIVQYQKAFNNLISRLKCNDKVLAVMVFGSIITGDLWEESDIDLFVILDEPMTDIKNIRIEEEEIPVHIKLMGKNTFIGMHNNSLKGSYMHRIFTSSRLVFSKDNDLTNVYDSGRIYPDMDRERWNMVYLGKVLKEIKVCKKYLHNNSIHTAYVAMAKTIEQFANMYVNLAGYMVSKNAISVAMDLNEEFKNCVKDLFESKENMNVNINNAIKFMENNINCNLKNMTSVLLKYMQDKDSLFSGEDIKNDSLFQNFDININEILEKLYEKQIIKRDTRDYRTSSGELLFKENVYFI